MSPLRVGRVGSLVLLSLLLVAGLPSAVFGAAPNDPSPATTLSPSVPPPSTVLTTAQAHTADAETGQSAAKCAAFASRGLSPDGCSTPATAAPLDPGVQVVPAVGCPCTISGTVTGAGGVPLDGIYVEADIISETTYFEAVTDSDGKYSITGVAAGTYVVYFGDPLDTHY